MGAGARLGPHLRTCTVRCAARRDAAHRDAAQLAFLARAAAGLPRPEPSIKPAGWSALRSRRRAPDGARTPSHLAAYGVHLCSERALSVADAGMVSFLRPLALLAHLLEWTGGYCAQVGDALPAYNGMRRTETPDLRRQRPTRSFHQRGRKHSPRASLVSFPPRPTVVEIYAGAPAGRTSRVGHAFSATARNQAHARNGHA